MGWLFDQAGAPPSGPPAPPTGQSPWAPPDIQAPADGNPQEVVVKIEAPDMQPGQPPTGAPAQPPTAAPPQPYPQNPVMQPSGPNDPFQTAPPAPVAPATPAGEWQGAPIAPPTGGGNIRPPSIPGAPKQPPTPGFNPNTPQERNQYGGQDMFADPNQADYDSVQQYSDQAYEQAQKRLEPQHAEQNRRLQQEMINKGIDPNSPQGQQMANQLAQQQADQNNSATFNALQFGQGIQNQMFGQEQQQADRAAQMQQALWSGQLGASGQNLQHVLGQMQNNLGWGQLQSGHALGQGQLQNQANIANQQNQLGWGQLGQQGQNMQNQYNLQRAGQDLQRYGMDQGHQLGMGNLDLGRQSQSFNELLGLEGIQFRDKQAGQQQQNWQDQFLYNMMMGNQGFNPGQVGGGGQFTSGPSNWGGNMLGGIGGMMPTSDRRLKKNIQKVGEISGVNLYQYDYVWDHDGTDRIGVMAQEVPWAAVDMGGYLAIDPRRVF